MTPRVVTLGETMVLINPTEQGPMKHITEFKKTTAGAESNVAVALARLGHDVGWHSKLGADPHGESIRSFVRGEGVDTAAILGRIVGEGSPTAAERAA